MTAGPTLPFHLDEKSRTSLDELFAPLDSEPTSADSIIVPFSRDESPIPEGSPLEMEHPKSSDESIESESDEFVDFDEKTILEESPLAEEEAQATEGTADERAERTLSAVIISAEDEADGDENILEADFFSVDSEEADEESLDFELAPPTLPTKEERDELKQLLSEVSEEEKSLKPLSGKDLKAAKKEVSSLGMEAPKSRPSGKRLTLVAAGLIATVLLLIYAGSGDDAKPAQLRSSTETDSQTFKNGQIVRPKYQKPPRLEPRAGQEAEQEAKRAPNKEETREVPDWRNDFKDVEGDPSVQSAESKKRNTTGKASPKEDAAAAAVAPSMNDRALAALMAKNDSTNLKSLKEDSKKALADMRTATEVSSDVLNNLFAKRSTQIKRCADRHSLTGKVVVKFTVVLDGSTSGHSVIATPTPPTSSGVECIEKIIMGWKFPPQDAASSFSKILVF